MLNLTDFTNCQRCNLAKTRTNIVFGQGDMASKIILLGHSPGAQEDLAGVPFVPTAPAGAMLDRLLNAANLTRSQCFIYNTVACHPPNNRDPSAIELAACRTLLTYYLQTVKPKVVVLLGQVALSRFWLGQTLDVCHGLWWTSGGRWFLASYHPSAVLHNDKLFDVVVHDLQRIKEFV